MLNNLKRFLSNEDGDTAIEYGLIAALIGVVIIVAVSSVGEGISGTFETIAAKLGTAGGGGDGGGDGG
jgi:pilus assembly protein Flp/PilA